MKFDAFKAQVLFDVGAAENYPDLAAALTVHRESTVAKITTVARTASIYPNVSHRGVSILMTEGWEGTFETMAKYALRVAEGPLEVRLVSRNEGEDASSLPYLHRVGPLDENGVGRDGWVEFIDGTRVDWDDIVAVYF